MTDAQAPVAVSVIVATRNRCAPLAETLEAMTRLVVPPALAWELIIVDNGSTDDTPALLDRYRARLPLRAVVEPVAGLSVARNAGLHVARGEVIAFTDDDCVVDPHWLTALWNEFASDPELAALGGRVELYDPRDWPITIRTSRVRERFVSPLQLSTLIAGCNMAFTRRTIELVGTFDTTLGAGTRVGGAEDMDFLYRAFRRALKIVYVPEVLVYHHHGRRTAAQVARLRRNYTLGRGALLCKYLLRADGGMLLRLYDDLASHVGEALRELRARRFPRRTVRHYWHMCVGACYWLTSRRRIGAVRRGAAVGVTPVPAAVPTES